MLKIHIIFIFFTNVTVIVGKKVTSIITYNGHRLDSDIFDTFTKK